MAPNPNKSLPRPYYTPIFPELKIPTKDQVHRVLAKWPKEGEGRVNYIHGVDAQTGFIIVFDVSRKADDKSRGDPNWSDVVFEIWRSKKEELQSNANLNWIFHNNVVSENTFPMLEYILGGTPLELEEVPAKKFTPDTDEFKALAGSDNGRGTLRLLADKKNALQSRTVKSVGLEVIKGEAYMWWELGAS